MIPDEQTIWVPPRGVAFTALCDECLAGGNDLEAYFQARVSGVLRLEDDRGWASCSRGHSIRVRRADPALAHAIR